MSIPSVFKNDQPGGSIDASQYDAPCGWVIQKYFSEHDDSWLPDEQVTHYNDPQSLLVLYAKTPFNRQTSFFLAKTLPVGHSFFSMTRY